MKPVDQGEPVAQVHEVRVHRWIVPEGLVWSSWADFWSCAAEAGEPGVPTDYVTSATAERP